MRAHSGPDTSDTYGLSLQGPPRANSHCSFWQRWRPSLREVEESINSSILVQKNWDLSTDRLDLSSPKSFHSWQTSSRLFSNRLSSPGRKVRSRMCSAYLAWTHSLWPFLTRTQICSPSWNRERVSCHRSCPARDYPLWDLGDQASFLRVELSLCNLTLHPRRLRELDSNINVSQYFWPERVTNVPHGITPVYQSLGGGLLAVPHTN